TYALPISSAGISAPSLHARTAGRGTPPGPALARRRAGAAGRTAGQRRPAARLFLPRPLPMGHDRLRSAPGAPGPARRAPARVPLPRGGDAVACCVSGRRRIHLLHGALGQLLEVLLGITDGTRVATDGAIGRCQFEDRLAAFLSHGDEAAVMLDRGQAIGIILLAHVGDGGFGKNRLAVDGGDALNPFIVGLHRPIQANTVLLAQIPDGAHAAGGQLEIRVLCFFAAGVPVVEAFLPQALPLT